MTDKPPTSAPDPDSEVPYLICKECGTPCYVFEMDRGEIREALCVACGNESVTDFLVGDWENEG